MSYGGVHFQFVIFSRTHLVILFCVGHDLVLFQIFQHQLVGMTVVSLYVRVDACVVWCQLHNFQLSHASGEFLIQVAHSLSTSAVDG